jgi:hypothetical protein
MLTKCGGGVDFISRISWDMQWLLFVLTLKSNSKGVMVEPHFLKPFTYLHETIIYISNDYAQDVIIYFEN